MRSNAPGEFYLGETLDTQSGKRNGALLHYASDNLTTHGVIVGMTGSGKTGLGMVLLEEALLSGIPTLIIDPKGDMGNLALCFPELRGADFQPWVDAAEAQRKGLTTEDHATGIAAEWRAGLESWHIDGTRLQALQEAAPVTIYTPGSSAGVPVNIVGSLAAPALSWDSEGETLRDEIEAFVTSLLTLAGIAADPVASREHVLLAALIEKSWQDNHDLDIAALIGQVLQPPLRKLGVFELDAFFPPADRQRLAMRLNGLVASPSFGAWLQGPPLDIQQLLYTPSGAPRAAVMYLAHLTDEERQFVVTLLLSKMVTWMRQQPGTAELRALVYMDEVFGYCPPTRSPPSKRPILTLLKQARAHGVGMLLATQNPVDLDYKAMSNAGTWMIGRLQTERDKARIMEGLKSAAGGVDLAELDARIGGLGKRQFVLHQTRATQPALFTTRWAMSYLRGPLTRGELARLKDTAAAPEQTASPTARAATRTLGEHETPVAPKVASGVPVYYLDPAAPWAREVDAVAGGTRLHAALVARVHLLFDDKRAGIAQRQEWEAVWYPLHASLKAKQALNVDYDERDLRRDPPADAVYVIPNAPVDQASNFKEIAKDLADYLYREQGLEVLHNPALKLYARPGEAREEFARRCRDAADQFADAEAAQLRERYAARIERVKDRIAEAERRLRELETDTRSRKQNELIAGAGALLSAFLGGRRSTRGLSGIASRRSQTVRAQERLRSAEERLTERADDLTELEDELAEDLEGIATQWQNEAERIEPLTLRLEKNDIQIAEMALLWVPTA